MTDRKKKTQQKLVDSIRQTKAKAATKKAPAAKPAAAKPAASKPAPKPAAAKKPAAAASTRSARPTGVSGYSSGLCAVWPD